MKIAALKIIPALQKTKICLFNFKLKKLCHKWSWYLWQNIYLKIIIAQIKNFYTEIEKRIKMAEYITISEFAKRANVSRQAIYKKLDKGLKNYLINDGHVLKISTDALAAKDIKIKSVELEKNEKRTDLAAFNDMSTIVNVIDKFVEIEKQNQVINNMMVQQISELGKALDKLTQAVDEAVTKLGSTLVAEDKKVEKGIWQWFISRKK